MELYDVEKTAELLGLSPLTIRKWLRSGKLKGTKIGKSWRISEDEMKRLFPEGLFFFPADSFEVEKPLVNVYGNEKLHEELYPESYKKSQETNTGVDTWEAFKEKIIEDIKRRFPYTLNSDEPIWNKDHTNCIYGGEPEARDIFYSKQYDEEVRKFNKLLETIQQKYGLKDEDIVEIKRTAENIILLTCGKEIYRVDF